MLDTHEMNNPQQASYDGCLFPVGKGFESMPEIALQHARRLIEHIMTGPADLNKDTPAICAASAANN